MTLLAFVQTFTYMEHVHLVIPTIGAYSAYTAIVLRFRSPAANCIICTSYVTTRSTPLSRKFDTTLANLFELGLREEVFDSLEEVLVWNHHPKAHKISEIRSLILSPWEYDILVNSGVVVFIRYK